VITSTLVQAIVGTQDGEPKDTQAVLVNRHKAFKTNLHMF